MAHKTGACVVTFILKNLFSFIYYSMLLFGRHVKYSHSISKSVILVRTAAISTFRFTPRDSLASPIHVQVRLVR